MLSRRGNLVAGLRLAWPLLAICAVTAAQAPDEETEAPCSGPEYRQFDFWVGEWSVKGRQRPPGESEWSENKTWIRTRVRADLSGCAIIEESIDRVDGEEIVVGTSISAYNRHPGKWQQTWVDQSGNVFQYAGGMVGDEMVLNLEHQTGSGQKLVPFQPATQIRMVFKSIQPDSLEWQYEYSTDGGKSWVATNHALYTRIE